MNDYKDKKESVSLNDELKKILSEINIIKDPKNLKDPEFKSISAKIYALRNSLIK